MDPIEELLGRIANPRESGKWPIQAERPVLDLVNTWVAFRDSDRQAIARVAGVTTEQGRPYRVDPLPDRIADAWAQYLFSETPIVTTLAESDAPLMAAVLGRDFGAELERAGALCVSEGEIWWRCLVDPSTAGVPILEWHSRKDVLPLWVGGLCPAVALVTELPKYGDDPKVVWRAFEVHATGVVRNVLYRGSVDKVGQERPLEHHPATAILPVEWRHNLPGLLMGRIPNRVRGERQLGRSDFAGILDYLLELNDAFTTGSRNAKLSSLKRAVVKASALRRQVATPDGSTLSAPAPRFDPLEQVFVDDPLDEEMGGGGGTDPVRILGYDFDADPLLRWKADLVESCLTRVGLSAQYAGLGAGAEGYAITGTALRLRLIPTDNTGRGKARPWIVGLGDALLRLAQLDALPFDRLGFGRPWADLSGPPAIARRAGLPPDDLEESQRHQALLAAGAESRRQAIRELHPDWTDQQVDAEYDEIDSDRSGSAPGTAAGGFGV